MARQPCARCGGPKESRVRGARLCLACRRERDNEDAARSACLRCGGDKGPHRPRGARYCDPCREVAARERREAGSPQPGDRTPCRRCGGEKVGATPKSLYCIPCRADVQRERLALKRKPCRRCGGEKEEGHPGSVYCLACHAARDAEKKGCERCGQPKGIGKGNRFCDACHDEVAPRCYSCHEIKPKRPGSRYCDDCAEVRHWYAQRKEATRATLRRKPCEGCGKVKPPGRARRFCDACVAAHHPTQVCIVCQDKRVAEPMHKLCPDCRATQRDRRNRQSVIAMARRTAADPERIRKQRERANKKRRDRRRKRPRKVLAFPHKVIPAKPLANYLGRLIAMEDAAASFGYNDGRGDGHTEIICERAGTTSRSLRAWRSGERPTVTLDIADMILTNLDAMWWDVWPDDDPETHEIAKAVFEGVPVEPRRKAA